MLNMVGNNTSSMRSTLSMVMTLKIRQNRYVTAGFVELFTKNILVMRKNRIDLQTDSLFP